MQIMTPILDTLKHFFHHFLGLLDGDLHLGNLAGGVFYGRLGDRVS